MNKLPMFVVLVFIGCYNIFAQNPYRQFGCEGKELLTKQEKSGERTFKLVSNDSLGEFEKIVFDFNSLEYIIYDKDNVSIKKGYFDLLIPKRWISRDPLSNKFPNQSPYVGFDNNPILLIDPDGKSTHTSKDGTVLAVYDDKNNGVYKQNVDAPFIGPFTTKTGSLMGQTKDWNEFLEEGSDINIAKNAKIEFNKKWDGHIEYYHNEALKLDLLQIGLQSTPNGFFDIKFKEAVTGSPVNPNIGREFNGYYITARSAGNYLAGFNAATGMFDGNFITWETFAKIAGALHLKKINKSDVISSTYNLTNILLFGKSFGPPPYYGEVDYGMRWTHEGWKKGMSDRQSQKDILKQFKNKQDDWERSIKGY